MMSEWTRTRCESNGCVEIKSPGPGIILLRTSDAPRRDVAMTRAEWDAFVAGVKAGDFDDV